MLSFMTQALLLFEEATTDAAEESSGAALLMPDKNEAIAGIIAFIIVFFFVWKWAVPALNKMLEARQQAIRAELEAAEAAKVEAQSLLDDYQEQIAGAKMEASKIVDDARSAGEHRPPRAANPGQRQRRFKSGRLLDVLRRGTRRRPALRLERRRTPAFFGRDGREAHHPAL